MNLSEKQKESLGMPWQRLCNTIDCHQDFKGHKEITSQATE